VDFGRLVVMHDRSTLGQFLRSRRERLHPEEVGIRSYGRRRVPGLRREELALLAGVSPTYYGRLEQGQGHQMSPSVIEALAGALRLSPDERVHLHTLARPLPAPTNIADQVSRPSVRQLVGAIGVPAVVIDASSDVLGWNQAGHRLVAPYLPADAPDDTLPPNLTRMLFLDPQHRGMQPCWQTAAACAVAALRVAAGRRPHDRRLRRLTAELSVASAEFAALWTAHPVAQHDSGPRRLLHPEIGEVELDLESLLLSDGSGQRILMYSAAPGSPSHAALAHLTARSPLTAADPHDRRVSGEPAGGGEQPQADSCDLPSPSGALGQYKQSCPGNEFPARDGDGAPDEHVATTDLMTA
jgi:transcriptional regulator with XRE-family HTH domain